MGKDILPSPDPIPHVQTLPHPLVLDTLFGPSPHGQLDLPGFLRWSRRAGSTNPSVNARWLDSHHGTTSELQNWAQLMTCSCFMAAHLKA